MGARIAHAVLCALAAMATACLEAPGVSCADGRLCPSGTVCHGTGCVAPGQIEACRDLEEGDGCTFGRSDGHCRGGACLTGCGDGVAAGAEDCDGADLAGARGCSDLGYHMDGPLACKDDCTYDVSQCGAICGDDLVDPGEQCEPGQPQELTDCTELGFYDPGDLGCSAACRYDVSTCTGFCGDGQLNGTEECDGSSLDIADCRQLDFYDPGPVSCASTCRYDLSACTGYCGDGMINGPELCEALPPAGETCVSVGFDAGLLTCSASCINGLNTCKRANWRTIADYASFAYFFGVWASATDDAYIVGEEGLFHWNGASLTQVADVPYGTFLVGVWGSGPDDVWAVGETAYHYDGTSWTEESPGSYVAAVWGSGPDDVYAVGGAVYHNDGTGWTQVVPTSSGLLGVTGSGPDDVWAVGNGGAVLHYDGDQWNQLDPGFTWKLRAVWLRGPGDVLVGGDNGIVSYDGNQWTQESSEFTFSFWGSGPDNVFASSGATTILHYDGLGWSARPHPNSLDSVALSGAGGVVYEVGGENALTRYDGMTVTTMDSTTSEDLNDVWGTSMEAFAVGDNGTIVHWDGMAWSPMTSNTGQDLRAVWGSAPDDVYAAGYTDTFGLGVLLHYDGADWTAIQGFTDFYTDIWGSGPDDVYVGALYSSALHYNGTDWSVSNPAGYGFQGVWGSGADDVYLSEPPRHFDGSSWSAVPNFPAGTVLHGSGPDNIVAVRLPAGPFTDDVHRFDGVAATNIDPEWSTGGVGMQGERAVIDVFASGPGDLLAVGAQGTLLHFDGATWWPLNSGVDGDLNGIGGARGTWFAVGAGGAIVLVTRDPNPKCPVAGAERDCQDSLDNDCDFLIDGSDPDCQAPGVCWAATEIACGDSADGFTGSGGSTIRSYGCSATAFDAPEDVYRVVPSAGGTLSATLTGLSRDADLLAVGATPAGACDPAGACLAASENENTSDEAVDVTVSGGEPIFLIVDSEDGIGTDYTLSVVCP